MKKLKRLLILALALIMSTSTLVGCDRQNSNVGNYVPDDADESKIITVERIKNGHGDDWTNELKRAYETVFPGYYVNLKNSTNDMSGSVVVRSLYRGYNKNGNVDLYITGNITNDTINKGNDYNPGTALAQDLTEEVYNKKAIGFTYDAESDTYTSTGEEDKTVMEKMDPAIVGWVKDTEDNALYYMPYINSNGGLAVNRSALEKFGYTELPVTTDELVEMATNIYLGKMKDGSNYSEGTAAQSGLYPFTYFTGSQYGGSYFYTAIAQTDLQYFENLKRFQDKDGNNILDGYEMYNKTKDGANLLDPLEMLFFSFDAQLTARGSIAGTLDTVQAKLVSKTGSRAVFMWNGDWVLNELKTLYPHSKDVLDFINYPVISSLGDEVFSALPEADRDAKLAQVIRLVDANKTIEEIVAEAGVTTAQATRIAEARGLYFSRASEAGCYVAPDSPKKDQVYNFLRLMASEGAAEIIARCANNNSVYSKKLNTSTGIQLIESSSSIAVNRYAKAVRWESLGMRKQIQKGSIFYTQGELLNKLWDEGVSSMFADGKKVSGRTWESVYGKNATDRLDAVYNLFKNNWDEALEVGGLKK